MPLYKPDRNPALYLPKAPTIKQWNPSDVLPPSQKTNTFDQPFEDGQLIKWNNGTLDVNVPQILATGFKLPAYAAEAPLRPIEAATNGGFSRFLKGFGDVTGLGPVVNAVQGGLAASSNAGGALTNYGLAHKLAWAIGKPDSAVFSLPQPSLPGGASPTVQKAPGAIGPSLSTASGSGAVGPRGSDNGPKTAGEIRAAALAQWGYNQQEDKHYTLQELEARARTNNWDFGSFQTGPTEGADFLNRLIVDPLNLIFFAGPATEAVRAGLGAAKGAEEALKGTAFMQKFAEYTSVVSRQAEWAKPVYTPLGQLAGLGGSVPGASQGLRWGIGFAKATGRGIQSFTRTGGVITRFPDVYAQAIATLEGNLANTTLRGFVHGLDIGLRGAGSIGRKVYFPGYQATNGKFLTTASKAWIRGGLQQEALTIGAEQLTGGLQNILYGNSVNPQIDNGMSSWMHTTLQNLNNQHPLSNTDAFVLATMFTPWGSLAMDVVKAPGQLTRRLGLPKYTEATLGKFSEHLQAHGLPRMKYDELLAWIGKGDAEQGRKMFSWKVERDEGIKVQNQFSDFFRNVAELDELPRREAMVRDRMIQKIKNERIAGGLRPQSTADYMLQLFKEGPKSLTGDVAPITFNFTPETWRDMLHNEYKRAMDIGPSFRGMFGVQEAQSSIMFKQEIEPLLEMAKKAPAGTIDRQLASDVINRGRALIYNENDLFQRLAVTLGQENRGLLGEGKIGRAAMKGENVTKDELVAALQDAYDVAPNNTDILHEVINGARQVQDINTGPLQIIDGPYDMNKKLQVQRNASAGNVRQLLHNQQTLETLRNTEFFKNGKPRLGTAKQLVGEDGGLFKRKVVAPDVYQAHVEPTVAGGSFGLNDQAKLAKLLPLDEKYVYHATPLKNLESVKSNGLIPKQATGSDYGIFFGGDNLDVTGLIPTKNAKDVVFVRVDRKFTSKTEIYDNSKIHSLAGEYVSTSAIPPQDIQVLTADKKWVPASQAGEKSANATVQYVRKTDGLTVSVSDTGQIKLDTPGFPYSVDQEGLRLAVQGGGRTIVMPTAEGEFLAKNGFKEVARIGEMPEGVTSPLSLKKNIVPFDDTRAIYKKGEEGGRPIGYPRDYKVGTSRVNPKAHNAIETLREVPAEDIMWAQDTADIARARQLASEPATTEYGSGTLFRGKILADDGHHRIGAAIMRGEKNVKVWVGEVIDDGRALPTPTANTSTIPLPSRGNEMDFAGAMSPQYLAAEDMPRITLEDLQQRYANRNTFAAYAYRGGDVTKIGNAAANGEFPAYRPTKLVVKSEEAALKRAHDSALSASLLVPSVDALGPSPSADGLHSMNPEARLKHIQDLTEKTRQEYLNQVKRVSAIDEKAMQAGFIPVKAPAMSDWIQSASPSQIDRYIETATKYNEDYPSITLEPGDRIYVDPRESRIQMLAHQRGLYRRMAFDYGYLNPISRFYSAVLAPINSKWIVKQFNQAMWDSVGSLGAKTPQITKFKSEIEKQLRAWQPTSGPSSFLGSRLIRSVHALSEGVVREAGLTAFGPKVHEEILAKYGNYQSMLSESGNRLMRSAIERERAGGKPSHNPLKVAAEAAYRIYQYDSGPISGYTRMISKLFYPILRFQTDPFWILFNSLESDLLGLGLNGTKGTRFAPLRSSLDQERRAQQLATSTVIPGVGSPRLRRRESIPLGSCSPR